VGEISLLLFLCWFLAQVFLLYETRQHWKRVTELLEYERSERSNLLDRLMARDFGQYKTAEALSEATKDMLNNDEAEYLEVGV